MARGGARNRSGPQPDPKSLKSAQTRTFSALPGEGFDGEAPEFPLPAASERELALWAEKWTTPQAAAWAAEPWRHHAVAMWVRLFVASEAPDAAVGIHAQVIRYADQIGLTPAGLKENGWTISTSVEVSDAEATDEQAEVVEMFRRRGRGA